MATLQDHIDNIYRSFGLDPKDFTVPRGGEQYALDHHLANITALLASLVSGGGGSGGGIETDPIFTAAKPNLALKSDLMPITAVIPSQASAANQLTDKNFVNSSIQNMAAQYVTPTAAGDSQFASLAALNAGPWYHAGLSYTPTKNDYAIFINTDNSVWRAGFDGTQWNAQYKINDSPFTAAQFAAINSNITANLTAKLTGLPDITGLNALLAGKLDATAQAADSAKLGGQLPSYYATASAAATWENIAFTPNTADGFVAGGIYCAINRATKMLKVLFQNFNVPNTFQNGWGIGSIPLPNGLTFSSARYSPNITLDFGTGRWPFYISVGTGTTANISAFIQSETFYSGVLPSVNIKRAWGQILLLID